MEEEHQPAKEVLLPKRISVAYSVGKQNWDIATTGAKEANKMMKQNYHLKIYSAFFTLRNGLDNFLLFSLIFGSILFLWFFDFDKELIKGWFQILLFIFLLVNYPSIPLLLSLYDQKKEIFTTSISPIKSFGHKSLCRSGGFGDIKIPSEMMAKFGIVSSEEDMGFD